MDTQTAALDYDEEGLSLSDYINILRRRKKVFTVTFSCVLVFTVLVAFLWPATYQSEAIILIEEQEVPSSLVRTTITSYAQQRIEVIKQRIMTISNIMSIVEQYGLYTSKELERKTRSEIARDFRDDVSISPISAEVVDPQSGRPRQAVIAFSLQFEGEIPAKVQQVTSELTNLYLDENLKERNEKTKSTTNFLASEAKSLSERLGAIDKNIATYKEEHKSALPNRQGFNFSLVDRTQSQVETLVFQLKELEKSKISVESNLIGMSRTAPVVLASGERVLGDADRLKALESEYREKIAVYRDDHPDLKRLKREIEDLLQQGVGSDKYEAKAKQLKLEKEKLASLEAKYTDSHPQVVASRQMVLSLEQELHEAVEGDVKVKPDNPAYLILNNQLLAIEQDIRANKIKVDALSKKLELHQDYISRGPQVERNLIVLVRELNSTQEKYNEVRAKQMHAELAQSLESEQKGERFTLIQPAEIPSEPVSPNRPGLIFFGLVLGGALAVGAAIIVDLIGGGVYGVSGVVKVVGAPPLITIGYMESLEELATHKNQRIYIVLGLLAAAIIFVAFFHTLVKPLDVTWFLLMRKFGLN